MDIIRHTVEIVDDVYNIRTFHKIVVHKQKMFYIGAPPAEKSRSSPWETTDAAAFVKQYSTIPVEHKTMLDHVQDMIIHVYIAELEEKKLSEYYLKWGRNGDR